MSDDDAPDERRTEGVRIIGAQEAADAADRPDVVRRRRGSEKRYGDRPDAPAAASDLPKITISTTEGEMGERYGLSGTARPEHDPAAPDPQWSNSGPGAYDDPERAGYGHARIVPAADPVAAADPTAAAGPEPRSVGREADEPFEPAATREPVGAPEWDDPYVAPTWSRGDDPFGEPSPTEAQVPAVEPPFQTRPTTPEQGSTSSEQPPGEPAAAVDDPFAQWDQPSADAAPSADEWESGWSAGSDPGDEGSGSVDSGTDDRGTAGDGGPADRREAPSVEDDSFILPHWTEPPTGQVPKVVVGEGAPEPEPLATYGSQPRWRDEGERTSVTAFDDLVDDGPALGALGNTETEDDFFTADPFGADSFTDEPIDLVDDEVYDEDDLDGDTGDEVPAARRRHRQRPRHDDEEPPSGGGGDRPLGVAIGVGVGLVLLGLLSFRLGTLTTAILATVVVTMAALEYFTAVRDRGNNPATLLGIVAVAALMIAAATSGLAAYPVVIGLTTIFGLLWYLWVAPGERSVANLGLTLLGVLWIGFLGSFATLFLGLGRVLEDSSPEIITNPGIGVLIAAVIASVSHDVGAYFTGKYLGRTPLSAASPNKTQEGLIGGVLASLVITFVIVGIFGISPIGDQLSQAFIFALLCAVVAPMGDLCESFIKRDLGIKDMGTVLPGHGGVLDRFDALLFVLPVAYFVTVLFDIWSVAG